MKQHESYFWVKFFFFFQAPTVTDPVVQWSSDITRYLTEPECNGSAQQRLKVCTPVRQTGAHESNLASRKRSPPNGAPKQSGVLGLLKGNESHNAVNYIQQDPHPRQLMSEVCRRFLKFGGLGVT